MSSVKAQAICHGVKSNTFKRGQAAVFFEQPIVIVGGYPKTIVVVVGRVTTSPRFLQASSTGSANPGD
ncbi:hypothetical protein IMW82_13345 [Rhodanobacter sp. B2A1Ga4]|uniref:hypothetical protein n=1 Tax=Rhodanobacter sp. B2A1Ga4 TaxID=2778647 RepID=UPI001B3779D0|nr:hypothetical protein [Rhodanobacter sp. B2A1Ga4]MBQ4855657.1 hypothetical protein [Rhodanobacter sp. B2A1Ga4]